MKVIIAGSREITDFDIVESAYIKSKFEATEIVSGAARGVDRLGELLAEKRDLKVKLFPADWDAYGKRAGFIRNYEMAKYSDALIAVWDGRSKGTENMILQANKLQLEVFVYLVRE